MNKGISKTRTSVINLHVKGDQIKGKNERIIEKEQSNHEFKQEYHDNQLI